MNHKDQIIKEIKKETEDGELGKPSEKLAALLKREADEEKTTQKDATDFVKRLLELSQESNADFKNSLLLSASDLAAITTDKIVHLKKHSDLEQTIAKLEGEHNALKEEL